MSNKSTAASSGFGFAGLLTVALIVLKLAQVGVMADASWLWCFAPLVIAPVLIFTLAFVILLVGAVLTSRR